MPSMDTLLELVEHGEKSFKLLDVSKWMGLLQNKMAILASWKEKALATIARCRDIYRLPEAPLDDAAQRDVCVIVQGPALSHSTKQKALRLERISIPRLPDHSFSISSVDLHVSKLLLLLVCVCVCVCVCNGFWLGLVVTGHCFPY